MFYNIFHFLISIHTRQNKMDANSISPELKIVKWDLYMDPVYGGKIVLATLDNGSAVQVRVANREELYAFLRKHDPSP